MMIKVKYRLFNIIKKSKKLLLSNPVITEDDLYTLLLNKIYDNFECVDSLFTSKHYDAARILLRSNIEIILTYIKLISFPNYKSQYKLDVELSQFKNLFVLLNQCIEIDDSVSNYVAENYFGLSKEDLITSLKTRLEQHFLRLLSDENKQKLLKHIKSDKFECSEENIKKLSKFFIQVFKFPKLEELYKLLKENNIHVSNIELRHLLFETYNEYSQIAHAMFLDHRKFPSDILKISYRLNNLVLLFSKDKLNIDIQDITCDMEKIFDDITLLPYA